MHILSLTSKMVSPFERFSFGVGYVPGRNHGPRLPTAVAEYMRAACIYETGRPNKAG
ncbi:MAG: hypothetical protein ACFCD0_23335 [Gemmataceae bacterium]